MTDFRSHQKLVRDNICNILEKKGIKVRTKILEGEEYTLELIRKALEESLELKEAKTLKERLNEIVDLYDVLDALIKSLGVSKKEIRELQKKKAEERGKFDKKIFLSHTEEG